MLELELPEGVTPEEAQEALSKLLKQEQKRQPTSGPTIYKEIESGNNQLIRVYRDSYKGREYLSIRRFYLDETSNQYLPGRGVTFHYEDIEEIMEGLQAMLEDPPGSPSSYYQEGV